MIYAIPVLIIILLLARELKGMNNNFPYLNEIRKNRDLYFKNIKDISLIYAMNEQESSFNPTAYRREEKINDASYGLMQVLYKTAVWMGFKGNETDLYVPEKNIYIGMKYFSYCIKNTENIDLAISAYNAGVKGATVYGRGVDYRDKVKTRWLKWHKKFIDNNVDT